MTKYENILLVDDDLDDSMLFRQILGEMAPAITIQVAGNGLEMISLLDSSPDGDLPGLIILDQYMPKMTGKESLLYLKNSTRYRQIPVLLYSTYQMKDFFLECRELGVLDILTKPDTIQAYREMIVQFILPEN